MVGRRSVGGIAAISEEEGVVVVCGSPQQQGGNLPRLWLDEGAGNAVGSAVRSVRAPGAADDDDEEDEDEDEDDD